MTHDLMAPLVLDGWYVLHQFFRMDPLSDPPSDDDGTPGRIKPGSAAESFANCFRGWEDLGEDGWSGLYRIVGGGTDLMAVHFRPSLEALGEVEGTIRTTPEYPALIPTGDYVSVVELGLYSITRDLLDAARRDGVEPGSEGWRKLVDAALAEERGKRYVQGRLRPRQPEEMPYVCFYPMDKRRNVGQNWYSLSLEERADLMAAHGNTGRRYAGRISQIISGSVGLDDWEWGVTLFATDPLDLKALVTEMRYDEVSALYAEFGNFWVGYRIATDAIEAEVAGSLSQ